MEPKRYAWVVPGRVAVAERPGGGGRTHRRERRIAEQAWWRAAGVTAVVSAMRSRHGLADYALDGLEVRWHPLKDPEQARDELPRLAGTVAALVERDRGAVLVHADHANEWLAAADAAVRVRLGLARDTWAGLAQAAGDGLPVGALAHALLDPVPAGAAR